MVGLERHCPAALTSPRRSSVVLQTSPETRTYTERLSNQNANIHRHRGEIKMASEDMPQAETKFTMCQLWLNFSKNFRAGKKKTLLWSRPVSLRGCLIKHDYLIFNINRSTKRGKEYRQSRWCADLTSVVVLWVKQVTELGQQLRPSLKLPFGGNCCDQDAWRKKQLP